MLYNSDERKDFANVLAAIDGFAEGMGIAELGINIDKVQSVLRGMRLDFPAQGGERMASPFKKAANFLCYFVSERPVANPFPEAAVGATVAKITNHQNAMVGLHIAFDALHGATIHRADGQVTLADRICLSEHSYVDLVQSCSTLVPASHFHLVSVLLEQMCYRFNPGASYDLVV